MANIIAGLGAQLGLDTTQFQKGISEAKSSLKGLMEFLAIASFTEFTKSSIEYANQIAETAKANEVAVGSVLDLTKALEVNGGSAENVGRIYSGFTQKIESAIQGNATAQRSFEKLGVSINDLKHLDTAQLFDKTIKGLGDMKDATERNGLAFMTLGKGIRGVDMKGLAETLDEVRGSSEKYANSIKIANEFTDKLKESSGNFKIVVNDAIIPSLNALYDSYTKTGTAVNFLHNLMEVLAQASVVVVKTITVGFSQLFDVVKAIGKWALDFSNLDFKKAGDDLFGGIEEVKKDGQEWLKFYQDMRKAVTEPPPVTKHEKQDRTVIDSSYKQLNQAESLAQQYQHQVDAMMQQVLAKGQLLDKTKNQQEQEKQLNDVFKAQENAVANIDRAIAALNKDDPSYGRVKAAFEKTKKSIDEITFKSLPEFQEAIKKNQAVQESFTFGWDNAYAQYKESAMTAADAGKQFFTNTVDTMTTALENFAKTGKLNFSSMVQSIIQDLIKLQIKYEATQMFKSFGFLGGNEGDSVSSIGGFFSKFFGGPKAAGGPVDGNTPYLIGEQGPEMFVPQGAGTIIPNNQLTNQSNQSVSNVTNYNINAIDTKSFEERILGSSTAVWAANQYGAKSLATTTGRT